MRVVWNIPNLLTLARVLSAPTLAWLILRDNYLLALYVFLGAAATDALDGFLARHLHQETEFGAALDPLADKLIGLTVLILLTLQHWIPLWLTLAVVVRDSVIVAGAFAYHRLFGELEIRPPALGKLHIFLMFIVLLATLAHAAKWPSIAPWLPWAHGVLLISALATLVQYVWLWGRKAEREAARRAV